MSMSKTVGATVRPVANEVPVTPMLSKPVDAYLQVPWGPGEPWSWYCQRALTGGVQQCPAELLHGVGAGRRVACAPALAGGRAARASRTRPIGNRSAARALMLAPSCTILLDSA